MNTVTLTRGRALPGKWAGTFTEDGDTCFWNVLAWMSVSVVMT